jgi:hypothetical protein
LMSEAAELLCAPDNDGLVGGSGVFDLFYVNCLPWSSY